MAGGKRKTKGVFLRKYKTGARTWYIRYTFQGRQVKEKVGPDGAVTERMAKEALKARLGEIATGKFSLPKAKTFPLFGKALDDFLVHHSANLRPESARRDATAARHLKRHFGKKTIDQITPLDVERYKHKRKRELLEKAREKDPLVDEREVSFRSFNVEYDVLRKFYRAMIRRGVIDTCPTVGVKKFKERLTERYLTEAEIEALLKACAASENTSLKAIVLTALNTGLRYSELMSLRVEDLDFNNGLVYVQHTKNGDVARLPMNSHLKAVLKEYLGKRINGEGPLWQGEQGRPLTYVRRAFRTALKRAGIKDFRFHDLRHTFASQLVMAGVDLYTVQRLMRHKSFAMTQRYAHLSPEYQRRAINSLNGLFTVEKKPPFSPQEEREEKGKVVSIG